MLRLPTGLSVLMLAAAFCLLPTHPAAAQTNAPATGSVERYDTPTLGVVQVRPSGAIIEVTAGPSGTPGGFTIDWMRRSDYDALGGWPDDVFATGGGAIGQFEGMPTVYVWQNQDFLLEPGGKTRVVLGSLFDETGVDATNVNELAPATGYVLRVRANGDELMWPSIDSPTLTVATAAQGNCTYTIGWWKTHPSEWPVPSLMLGNIAYTTGELLSILDTAAKGNGLLSLAHQLIAAKLSIAQGADPTPVASTIAAADAQIGSLVCPPLGTGFLAPGTTASKTVTLDQYNNGLLGVNHCDPVPATASSWGGLKVRYR